MSSKGWAWVVIGLAFGLCCGAAVLLGSILLKNVTDMVGAGQDDSSLSTPEYRPASDFELPDLYGQTWRLSDWRGQVVLLNFWASWCGPCVQEMPLFEEYGQLYTPDLVIVGVNMEERPAQVQSFIDEMGISYLILLDEEGVIGRQFRVNAIPDTYFIDRQGMIRQHHIGSLTSDQLQAYLSQLGLGE